MIGQTEAQKRMTDGGAVRLLEAVGNTPLLDLSRIARGAPGLRLLAKAEYLNPGGSVKDRPARAMLLDGLERGLLTPGKRILEATSGNTGIADAMIGRALGFPVTLCLPEKGSSAHKTAMLRAFGAELVLTDPLEGTDGAIRKARAMAAAEPDKYFYPDQYSNPANWRAHFETTGPEIWGQTRGELTHFVAGLGTSGTFMGVARYLKSQDPSGGPWGPPNPRSGRVACVSMQPDGPMHGLDGMKHMASAMVPAIYDPSLADANLEVATEDAFAMCRRLAREEGVLVGPSAAANVVAALRVARDLAAGPATIVTILCDGGGRYLSEPFWELP
jgi:S-sulfo-L-cysteine synthase (O-acetyl-L-serine-dependent)